MNKQKLRISVQLKPTKSFQKLILLYVNIGNKEEKFELSNQQQKEFEKAKGKPKKMEAYFKKYPDVNSDQKIKKVLYKPFVISSRLSLPEKFFDRETKLCLNEFEPYNKKIESLINSITLLFQSMQENKPETEITVDQFKTEINKVIFQKENGQDLTFRERKNKIFKTANVISASNKILTSNTVSTIFTDYILKKVQRIEAGLDDERGEGSAKNFKQFREWWIRFDEQVDKNGNKIRNKTDLLTMDDKEVEEYFDFFKSQNKPDGKHYSLKYLGWHKAQLKNLLTEARIEDKIPVKVELKIKALRRKKDKDEETDDVHFSPEQIQILKEMKFDVEDKIERELIKIRDLCVMNCEVGANYSDLPKVQIINTNGEVTYKYFRGKTGNLSIGTIFDPDFMNLWKKYKGFPKGRNGLKIISEGNFNENIKTLCLLAGFKHKVQKTEVNIRTKKKRTYEVEFYKEVSSRSCRKSMATNYLYKLGLQITKDRGGWSTEKSLIIYLCLKASDLEKIHHKQSEIMRIYNEYISLKQQEKKAS